MQLQHAITVVSFCLHQVSKHLQRTPVATHTQQPKVLIYSLGRVLDSHDHSYFYISLRAKLSYAKHSYPTLEQKLSSLTKLGVTPVHCSRQCCEDCKSGTPKMDPLQTIQHVSHGQCHSCPFVRGSSANNTDVNIQSTHRDVQNTDKR